MGKIIDLTGQRFGRLVVIEQDGFHECPSGGRLALWKCVCDCGSEKTTTSVNLLHGDTRSCGCLKRERDREWRRTHGETHTKLHKIWVAMRRRCSDPNNKDYKYYGGKGVKVCDEWSVYMRFREWAYAHNYTDGLTIDRIDPNGDYCPNNCRWVSFKEQCNNRTNNRLYDYNGMSLTIAQLAEMYHLKYTTLYNRLMNGWSVDKAVSKSV